MQANPVSAEDLARHCADYGCTVSVAPASAGPVSINARFWSLGTVGIVHSRTSPLNVRRSRADIAGDRGAFFLLPIQRHGTLVLRQGRQQARIGAGGTSLIAGCEPYALDHDGADAAEGLTLALPVDAIGLRVSGIGSRIGQALDCRQGALHLLGQYLAALAETPPPDAALGEAAGAHVIDLACLALGGAEDAHAPARPAIRAARLARLRQLLARHAGDPCLDLDRLAHWMGLSPRSIQALLAGQGSSFGAELRAIRVRRAERLLRMAPGMGIAQVAFATGFADLSTFNRAFRALSGCTPSDWRRAEAERLSGQFKRS